MSRVIPKEEMTAYQRWELASFNEEQTPEQAEALLAAQRNKATEEARLAGYAAGLAEGRAAGMEEGRAAGTKQGYEAGLKEGRAEAEDERTRLQQLALIFQDEITNASERIAADVMGLALDVSKAMLKNALEVRPELVLPIVGDAIRYLPTVQQPAMLFLHPADAELIRNHMHDELKQTGWRIVEDAQLERGGCRVETATNQIDATTEARWQRIAAALGKESEWLEP